VFGWQWVNSWTTNSVSNVSNIIRKLYKFDAGSDGLYYVQLYIANIPNVISTAFTDVKLVRGLL
jgi:hypothetical protein